MITRRARVGFDRKIKLEWLDATAARVASSPADADVRGYLADLLSGELSDGARRGAVDKTVTVLSHMWSRVPRDAEHIRSRGLALLPLVEPAERLGLHWTMAVGTYPFFADIATATGRLLALQGEVSLAAITRRLVSQWGDRSTMVRAAQRVVRSMAQWGALECADAPGTYRRAPRRTVHTPLAELLVEALLIGGKGQSLAVTQVESHPALFPFVVRLSAHQLRESGRFVLHRQGLDTDVVELAASNQRR